MELAGNQKGKGDAFVREKYRFSQDAGDLCRTSPLRTVAEFSRRGTTMEESDGSGRGGNGIFFFLVRLLLRIRTR